MFKRVRKELEKQQIEDREIDADDKEERLAGIFSDTDTDSDSDNSDDEQTKRYKKKARKELIKTVNQMADLQGSDDGDDSELEELDLDDMDDSEIEDAEGNDVEAGGEEEEEELVDTFSCDICPAKKLKTVEQVNVHLKSKDHIRRVRYMEKNGSLPVAEEEDEELPEDIKEKIAAKMLKIEQDRAAKEKALKEKKEAKKLSAKEKAKAHRKLVKQKKWERVQALTKEKEEAEAKPAVSTEEVQKATKNNKK